MSADFNLSNRVSESKTGRDRHDERHDWHDWEQRPFEPVPQQGDHNVTAAQG
jgi:hypothetical protein